MRSSTATSGLEVLVKSAGACTLESGSCSLGLPGGGVIQVHLWEAGAPCRLIPTLEEVHLDLQARPWCSLAVPVDFSS